MRKPVETTMRKHFKYLNHFLIRTNQVYSTKKPNSKGLYSLPISIRDVFSTFFLEWIFKWNDIYTLLVLQQLILN